ncbi:MAG: oxidoreductase [Bryobacterales bacterium]|nr:oxidoreductase [Bryobacterales bacterium]
MIPELGKTEALDVRQLHAIDPKVPVEESLGAAVKLQAQGKIKDIGLCRVTLPEIKQVRKVAKIVSIQNIYNIGHRPDEDVVKYCEEKTSPSSPGSPSEEERSLNPATNSARQPGATTQPSPKFPLHGYSTTAQSSFPSPAPHPLSTSKKTSRQQTSHYLTRNGPRSKPKPSKLSIGFR